jgi:hypothetical protein
VKARITQTLLAEHFGKDGKDERNDLLRSPAEVAQCFWPFFDGGGLDVAHGVFGSDAQMPQLAGGVRWQVYRAAIFCGSSHVFAAGLAGGVLKLAELSDGAVAGSIRVRAVGERSTELRDRFSLGMILSR